MRSTGALKRRRCAPLYTLGTGLAYGGLHRQVPSGAQPEWRCSPRPTSELHCSCAPSAVKSAGHIVGTARNEYVRLALPYALTQMNTPAAGTQCFARQAL